MYFKRLVSFQMHTNRVFNGLRLNETAKQSLLHPEGGYSQKIWVGVCGPLVLLTTCFGGFDLLALLAFFPSVISSFFTQNNWGPGPSPRSATDLDRKRSILSYQFASEYHRHPRALDRPLCAAGILGR